jgi:hypothetical protein
MLRSGTGPQMHATCVCKSLAGIVPWVRRLDKLSFYLDNTCTSSLENTVYFVRHFTPLNKSFPPGPSFAVNRVPFYPEAANQSETPARDSTSEHVTAELA